MITAKQWKSKTSQSFRRRSDELKNVDATLRDYEEVRSPSRLDSLCKAVEEWSKSKQPSGELNGGASYLLNSDRNKSSGISMLFEDLIKEAGKAAYWPDETPGEAGERDYTYVVEGGLTDAEKMLMNKARQSATHRSVEMISKMEADWTKFAFDQVKSVALGAIDLGHTDFSSNWDHTGGKNPNATSGGQFAYGAIAKIFSKAMGMAADEVKEDPRLQNILTAGGFSVSVLLGVLKYHLFKEGVMSKTVPLVGQVKGLTDALITGSLEIRVAVKSNQRVAAAKPLLQSGTTAAEAIDLFEKLVTIETTKNISQAGIDVLVNTATIVLSVFATPAITIVNVVKMLVDIIVDFIYQFAYYIVFKDAVGKCRDWVESSSAPEELDFRAWCANCPLLGAYFLVGLAGTAGAPTALSMFAQAGVPMTSSHFQVASVKLLKVRQSASFFISRSPVKVGWVDDDAKNRFGWIGAGGGSGGLIEQEKKSASVGLSANKIHDHILTDHAETKDKFKHKFLVVGEKCYSYFKTAWDVF